MNIKTLVIIAVLFFFVHSVSADSMTSPLYRIQYGNINIGSENQSSDNYSLSTTVGQTAANEFESDGYIIKAGFQYLPYISPFYFSISDISIDLGTLIPQSASTETTTLTVRFEGAGQYIVTAIEDGPLTTTSGADTISDTSCNGEAETCTESSANVWTSPTAYGFGYNMSGDSIPEDFESSDYYRPFPDSKAPESPQTVMSSPNVTSEDSAIVTFRTNIGPAQEAGTYQTVIRFTATPSF